MTEIDLDRWPDLTDTQRTFMGYVAAHTTVEIPWGDSGSSYAVGTYEVADEAQELLARRVVFRLTFSGEDPKDAYIFFENAYKDLILSLSFGPDELPELQAGETQWDPFWVNIGDHDDGYDEKDEPIQVYLNKLRALENAGHLVLIETDPSDHVPGWSKEE